MLPYNTLINLNRDLKMPLYLQICNGFIQLITNGTIQYRDALPSTRKLSELLLINRNTVNLAYDELVSQGWAETVDRKGIFVSENLEEDPKQYLVPLNWESYNEPTLNWNNGFKSISPMHNQQKIALAIDDGLPDVRLAPVDQLMVEYRSISKRFYGRNFLKYGNPKGSDNLRATISRYLATTRGIIKPPENIMITKGSQMGLYLIAQLLLERGGTIAVGSSNYHTADDTFRLAKGELLRIPVDEHGMDIDYLEWELRNRSIKGVYVIPHHHFPTTVTMPSTRRQRLLDLAVEHHFIIIEDDYDYEFDYENKSYLPMASMDKNECVISIGSFSKTIAPSLRMGFMVGPLKMIDAATKLRKYMDRQGDTLFEEAFSALFLSGEIDRYFRKTKKIYRERRNIFCDLLSTEFNDTITFDIPDGGFAVWSKFEKGIDLIKVTQKARNYGLHILNENFHNNMKGSTENTLRMGFASLEVNEMNNVLGILKKSMA